MKKCLNFFISSPFFFNLDDPTGGSYGNDNFSDIFDYMYYEGSLHNRSVAYYPETAYWVNVDVDVPLFLPLYSERRLYDMRKLGNIQEEEKDQTGGDNFAIDGIINFDSGWEWGYWFSDVITARSFWNPMLEIQSQDEAFLQSMKPVSSIFPQPISHQFEEFILQLVKDEYSLLIKGEVDGTPSPDLSKLSGFPYLSGDDTWVDLPRAVGITLTQPDKIHLDEQDDELYDHVLPLLSAMEVAFEGNMRTGRTILDEFGAMEEKNEMAYELLEEIVDSVTLLHLRSKQVRCLYESTNPSTPPQRAVELQLESRLIITTQAQPIVKRREGKYRVPWERIGSWRENPTVYRYGYVWSVHKLYYWWRDQGLAEERSMEAEYSPCYLNRIDSTEVAVGVGKYAFEALRVAVNNFSPHENADLIVNCISPPPKEYEFPEDLFKY